MKISAFTKRLGVMALVLGVAVGCATAEEAADVCEGISPEVQAAIDRAQSVNDDARAMGAEWTEAQDLIGEAEAAGRDCRDEEALRLAREAERMAQQAIQAYRAAQEEDEPMMESADRSYTVSRGDTLWGISGRSVGYNDPYQWPLIYRANTNVIEDADLIYPGQDLTIEADPSGQAVDAAIEHAKTRGEWSLGRVEDSDRRYLNRWGM